MYSIILASASPRRKELLEQIGVVCTVMPSKKEEVITKTNPIEVVEELSFIKASDIAGQVKEESIIIGADTIVVYKNEILGKPKDKEHAFKMIKELQGNVHQVYTGVSLIIKPEKKQEKIITCSVETKVGICSMTDEQIYHYIDTKEPLDKAGAYAIQGKFAIYINHLDGDYYNVVGLPISKIYEMLWKEGIDICSLDK